ncbi:MAG: beta-1,6-N-acetylglucosaminyltransferase [Bacteroidales bacterium]|nr:beta-1,6-N-acetylglucosaminyltransferase [Bacteroidales bacterium]
MGRHAYLILAHDRPGQLKTLLRTLDDSRNDIFVHIDAKAAFSPDIFEGVCKRASLSFTSPRIKARWGGFSLAEVELALLQAATASHHQYYHLLSGMDLPIKSQDFIHNFFDSNDGKEFINFWVIGKRNRTRFNRWSPFPEGGSDFLLNFINNVAKAIQVALGIRINRGIEFKYGSQWFSITDDMARYVLSRKDWIYKTFRHTTTCDEVFIPTLVWESPFRENVYDKTEYSGNSTLSNTANLRLIDWSRGTSSRHPWVFVSEDFELLASAPHLWARKFDEKVDSSIIDAIVSLTKADV